MPNPIDFKKVEELRKHMLIPVGDWVGILGASRMTYYKWVNGMSTIRPKRQDEVRVKIKSLLAAVANGWPTAEIKGLEPSERTVKLLAQIGQLK